MNRRACGPTPGSCSLARTAADRPKRLSSAFTAEVDRAGLHASGSTACGRPTRPWHCAPGCSPEVVSKRLGHSSVVIMLTIYAHVFEEDDEAAAELVAEAIYGE